MHTLTVNVLLIALLIITIVTLNRIEIEQPLLLMRQQSQAQEPNLAKLKTSYTQKKQSMY